MNEVATRSVIPDAATLVESWERAAAGREPGENVVKRTPQIDWGGLLFWSVMVLYGLALVAGVRWLCGF